MAARVGVGNRPRGAGSAFGPVTTTTVTKDIAKAGVNQTLGQRAALQGGRVETALAGAGVPVAPFGIAAN